MQIRAGLCSHQSRQRHSDHGTFSNADVLRVLPKLAGYGHLYVTESQFKVIEGPPKPEQAVGSGIRFDLRTGRGRGLELNEPPFNRQADEVLRIESGPGEDLVAYRVRDQPSASRATSGSGVNEAVSLTGTRSKARRSFERFWSLPTGRTRIVRRWMRSPVSISPPSRSR